MQGRRTDAGLPGPGASHRSSTPFPRRCGSSDAPSVSWGPQNASLPANWESMVNSSPERSTFDHRSALASAGRRPFRPTRSTRIAVAPFAAAQRRCSSSMVIARRSLVVDESAGRTDSSATFRLRRSLVGVMSHRFHHEIVRDTVEEGPDVRIDHPVLPPAALAGPCHCGLRHAVCHIRHPEPHDPSASPPPAPNQACNCQHSSGSTPCTGCP